MVCDGPGRADRVGYGDADGQLAMGEGTNDCRGQGVFTAEQMGQAGDVQQQTFRGLALFDADDRTEPPAPRGQRPQRTMGGNCKLRIEN